MTGAWRRRSEGHRSGLIWAHMRTAAGGPVRALTVRMENLPGAGAATFRRLADAGVNVELLLPVRISDKEFFAVICADDAAAAEAALGGQVISE